MYYVITIFDLFFGFIVYSLLKEKYEMKILISIVTVILLPTFFITLIPLHLFYYQFAMLVVFLMYDRGENLLELPY